MQEARQESKNALSFHNLSLPSWHSGATGITANLAGGKIHAFFCINDILLRELCDALMFGKSQDGAKILFNGRNAFDASGKASVRTQAVLKQENLFMDLSVADNIYMPQDNYYFINRSRIKRDLRRLLMQMEADVAWNTNRPVGKLTAEVRKLVELLRCYVSRPDILILHETLSYFSREGIHVWHHIIGRMKEQGTVIIYLTGKIEETVYLADAVTVLTQSGCKGNFTSQQMRGDLQNIYHLMLDGEGFMSYYTDRSEPEKNLLEIIDESSKFIYNGHGINNALNFFARKLKTSLKAVSLTILLIDGKNQKIIDRVDFYEADHLEWQLSEAAVMGAVPVPEEKDSLYCTNYKVPEFASCFKQAGDARALLGYSASLPTHVRTLIIAVYDRDFMYSHDDVRLLTAVSKELAIILENSRLANRSALLFESHHRIKNNLQMVISLLLIQKMMITRRYEKQGDVPIDFYLQNIDDLFYRIKSIALIHDMMSKEERSEGMASLGEIIGEICNFYRDAAIFHTGIKEIGVPYSISTSIALVINELISNAIKHSAAKAGDIVVRVEIYREEDKVILEVSDNGPGFVEMGDSAQNSGIGIKLISGIIANELHGAIKMYNEGGARVRVTMPDKILL